MIFRQLLEPDSCTYTYLLACERTGACVLIDPVIDTVERDLHLLHDLGLRLTFTLETHIHADHLSGASKLRRLTGSRIAVPALDRLACADIGVEGNRPFRVGDIELMPLFAPGHTATHHAYVLETNAQTMLFSGDALLIEACGRTDFQSGDPAVLYRTITEKLFTLPDETLVYPAHDYEERFVTTIGQEKRRNPRVGRGKSLQAFVDIMNSLDLPYPRKIDFAVPGNEACGECPENVPEQYRGPCETRAVPAQRARVARSGDQG